MNKGLKERDIVFEKDANYDYTKIHTYSLSCA